MIIGEGSVFLVFLFLGIFILWRNIQRESKLSGLQNNFLLSVTHELKSPIASIQLLLETLQKRELEELNKKDIIKKALIEADRLDATSDKILLATRVETEQGNLHFEKLNLSELINRIILVFSNTMGSDHKFELNFDDNIWIQGDRQALQSLISNLIENSIKYSPKSTIISIALKQKENGVCLTVKDKGFGIPPKEQNQIFEKFYRIGNEETRASKGTGLGLFLVKRIADLHGASVAVTSTKSEGTIFKIEFKNEK